MKRSRWKFVGGKLKAHILEDDVVKEITARLWLEYRIRVWRIRERIPGTGMLSTAGIPDLIGWVGHKASLTTNTTCATITNATFSIPLFIECKRPGGAHRPAQTLFINAARQDGCIAFFADSWASVVREMQEQCGIPLNQAC